MNRSEPGTFFSVIVNMTEQAPVPALNAQLPEQRATRLERNRTIITAVQGP